MGLMIDTESGVGRIALERIRQIEEKGWTKEHDKEVHDDESLVDAASALLLDYRGDDMQYVSSRSAGWVREFACHASEKYRQRRKRLLEIAGALIAAELDRIG